MPPANAFVISRSFRLPGLGLLVLPVSPVPPWLASADLHTAWPLCLQRPGQPPLPLTATVEEIAPADGLPTRALLLEADLGGLLLPGAWLLPEPN
ncbi:hypothetical protein GCM10023172_26300 [Hymenobacter ginsengisoli]|uniref:Secreted protein n=1 Tax=Hymenobacter ginsengisoli TaxID=1051626 RepID=A0ABP8QGA0_9BACT|nr:MULTISPECIES: hypothetical protein [unclassified Hymenobacter]MBO2030113.1 hypothetical protein [Hymenobacter sp. BT559]